MKKTLIFLGIFGIVAWLFPQILSFLFTLLILIIILAVWGAIELSRTTASWKITCGWDGWGLSK